MKFQNYVIKGFCPDFSNQTARNYVRTYNETRFAIVARILVCIYGFRYPDIDFYISRKVLETRTSDQKQQKVEEYIEWRRR